MGVLAGRPRVLLIDDSEIASEVACAVLEDAGFEVRAASSLGEFSNVLKTWSPNIVLADVNMPGVSGPDLCKWIKVRVDTQTVPVVLYSDMPEAPLADIARESGADAYVSKESGLARVSQKLSELCEEIVW
jgi:chemotaxis family two-component system response regulator PixH